MKVSLNKKYRTRNGFRVSELKKCKPWKGSDVFTFKGRILDGKNFVDIFWMDDGRFHPGFTEHELDLVEIKKGSKRRKKK